MKKISKIAVMPRSRGYTAEWSYEGGYFWCRFPFENIYYSIFVDVDYTTDKEEQELILDDPFNITEEELSYNSILTGFNIELLELITAELSELQHTDIYKEKMNIEL